MRTLSSRWQTRDLITALARAGWGPLADREVAGARSVLQALVACLDYHSGQGLTTAAQVADTAGLSERWTRTRLALLEDAGLITWNRGGVVHGKPQPSFIRIVKTALVDLIKGARPALALVLAARRKRTAHRLAGLRRLNVLPRGTSRRSSHAELSASPIPLRGGDSNPPHLERSTKVLTQDLPECSLHVGNKSGRMASGLHRCPMCRRTEAREQAQAKAAQTQVPAIPVPQQDHLALMLGSDA